MTEPSTEPPEITTTTTPVESQPLDIDSLPAAEGLMHGARIDLLQSKPFSKWVEKAPHGQLSFAPVSLVEEVEQVLDQQITPGLGKFIHIGRNRFELVSDLEGDLFREERRAEDQLRRTSPLTKLPVIGTELDDCAIINGISNPQLASDVTTLLGKEPTPMYFGQFPASETRVLLEESLREKRVFMIQSICDPVNEALAESILTVDALKRNSAGEINLVIPFFGYSRGDRQGNDRTAISMAALCRMFEAAGVKRIMTVDIHSEQAAGFFDGPFEELPMSPALWNSIAEEYRNDRIAVVGADGSEAKRLQQHQKEITHALVGDEEERIAFAAMFKIRRRPGVVEEMKFIGNPEDIKGRVVILPDDLIDTGGTIVSAAQILSAMEPKAIVVRATHLLASQGCVELFRNTMDESSPTPKRLIDRVFTSDSIPLRRARGDLITSVSSSELLALSISTVARGVGASLRELWTDEGYQRALRVEH